MRCRVDGKFTKIWSLFSFSIKESCEFAYILDLGARNGKNDRKIIQTGIRLHAMRKQKFRYIDLQIYTYTHTQYIYIHK